MSQGRHEILNALAALEASARLLEGGRPIPDLDAFKKAVAAVGEHVRECLGDDHISED